MDSDAITTLINAARQGGAEVIEIGNGATHYPVLLHAREMTVTDLHSLLKIPDRVRQRVALLSPEAFTAYVLRFATADTLVLADEENANYVAFIDYHKADGGAAWLGHAVQYQAPFSPEWQTWTAANEKPMPQELFARFIEDNVIDVTTPTHAELIEVSRRLEVTKGVNFKSSKRLQDGQTQFEYVESQDAQAGTVRVPEDFTLALPVFRGGPRYEVKARLRYRLSGPSLSMWYELVRIERVRDAAVAEVSAKVREGLGDKVPLFLGKADAPTPVPSLIKRDR